MPWTDLNALLGLPPENPAPRPMSPLSASMLQGDAGQYPANDIGEVGPSSPRMGADSEDRIGQAGPLPPQGWTGGNVQGMPAQNIGQVGDRLPQQPQAAPKSDMADYGPLTSTKTAARLPLPLGMEDASQAQPSAGEGASAPTQAPADATPPPAASLRPKVDIGELNRKRAMALVLAERGTPAQRVRGKLTLYEVEKELKKIEEGEAEAKQLDIINTSIADPDAKSKAATLARLGAKTGEIAEALGFDDKGAGRAGEKQTKLDAHITSRATDSRVASTLKAMAADAYKLIDSGWQPTTGTMGHVAGLVPGSNADKLRKSLSTIQAVVGFDRLQQMREQSKTGGALGSIAVKELEFLQAVQGSLDIAQDPQVLKRNIGAIVRAQQLFANMRKLVPGLEVGDPEAIEAYAMLNGQLGSVDADAQRILETKPKLPPRPPEAKDADILRDAQEAMKRANPEQREKIARQLDEWGVKF